MKKFFAYLSVILFFSPSSVIAEEYDEKIIYSNGSWKVASWAYAADSISCAAGNLQNKKEFFIEVNPYENYEILGFWYNDFERIIKLKRVTFQIDSNRGWFSDAPEFEDGSIWVDFDNASDANIDTIIGEIMNGKKLIHLDDSDKVISTFDLSGSFASMRVLIECLENI